MFTFKRSGRLCRQTKFKEGVERRNYGVVVLAILLRRTHGYQNEFCLFAGQYSSVLTCLAAQFVEKHNATQKCSYRLRHRGQSSGDLRLKGPGGMSCIPAISMLEFSDSCHHVALSILSKLLLDGLIQN